MSPAGQPAPISHFRSEIEPPPPWYAGPAKRVGEARSAFANASFPSTLSEPTIGREETGESTTSPDTTSPRDPVAAQLMRHGSRTAAPSRTGGPSHVMMVLPTLIWKRLSELGTPFSSSVGTRPTAS